MIGMLVPYNDDGLLQCVYSRFSLLFFDAVKLLAMLPNLRLSSR